MSSWITHKHMMLGAAAVAVPLLMLVDKQSIAQNSETAAMSFFITSQGPGNGADLGGLSGADAHCQTLADAVGAGDETWRAYLSTAQRSGVEVVNARDRIGAGPWFNAAGVKVADDVEELHGENNLSKETALDERGENYIREVKDEVMFQCCFGLDFR